MIEMTATVPGLFHCLRQNRTNHKEKHQHQPLRCFRRLINSAFVIMSGHSEEYEKRVKVKRSSKKKSGFEVEKRDDGFYYREFG